jgi:ubiquitin-conjugating enzyme E2 J2
MLEWHFVLEGASDSEYAGGIYHGKLVFPAQYPFKPPSISFFTPTGRFAVNTKLCLSITDYHPESWNPMWSVGTILTGLLSFMYDNQPTTGSITTSKAEKQRMAKESLAFNMKSATFVKLFPDWVELHRKRVAEEEAKQQQQQEQELAAPNSEAAGKQAAGAGAATAAGTAAAGGAAAAVPAQARGGSSLFTMAAFVVVLAVMVVPLLTSGGAKGLAVVADGFKQ